MSMIIILPWYSSQWSGTLMHASGLRHQNCQVWCSETRMCTGGYVARIDVTNLRLKCAKSAPDQLKYFLASWQKPLEWRNLSRALKDLQPKFPATNFRRRHECVNVHNTLQGSTMVLSQWKAMRCRTPNYLLASTQPILSLQHHVTSITSILLAPLDGFWYQELEAQSYLRYPPIC